MKLNAALLNYYGYPNLNPDELLNREVSSDEHVFVVLDDDPTGVQCVHDVSVYTDWSLASMLEAFRTEKIFFLLTNSRAMTAEQTAKMHVQIAEIIAEAARQTGKKYLFVSRSDSTLRGHYPLETDILRSCLEQDGDRIDGEIFVPFFKEGGRYTVDNVHYVRYGDELIPCAETEFARDKTFGYVSSDLREYIEEKTKGACRREDVLCFSLEELRKGDLDGLYEKLMRVSNYQRIIVNAIDYLDLKIFCIVLFRALKQGKTFLFRCAASLVRCLGAISEKNLLKREEMIHGHSGMGGLIVVGSHTDKTNRQLEHLLELEATEGIEFQSSSILYGKEKVYTELKRCLMLEEQIIRSGRTAVVYTERELLSIPGESKEEALQRSVNISTALVQLVKNLQVRPSFLIAKGGITSADIGVRALGVRKAMVLGQIRPGVPVWQTDGNSRFPDIPYVIFPGNVGEDETLKETAEILL